MNQFSLGIDDPQTIFWSYAGVYWFCFDSLNCQLQLKKPVRLEIQHCAKPAFASSLSFVRASSKQDRLPYTFKCLKGGDFTSCNCYGVLEVNKFCGIAAIGSPESTGYLASLFYLRHETVHRDIRFVVTLNTEIHRKVSLIIIIPII